MAILDLISAVQDSEPLFVYGKLMKSHSKIASNTPLDPPSSPLHCLKKIEIFSNLADEEVAPFQNAAQIRSYKKGR
jgi:hypothetical protein